MRLQAPKKVRTTMHVQHYPLTMRIRLLSRPIIALHLYPFTFKIALRTAPLPPCPSTNALDASLTQLRINMARGFGQVFVGNDLFLNLDPGRRWDLLGRERLQVLNCVVRGMFEEGADDIEALVIRYVSGGFLVTGFSVDILWAAQLTDGLK